MSNIKWDISNIPDLSAKVVIVTGASSGLGLEATKVLASKNATVIMAVRNTDKAERIRAEILKASADSVISVRKLDLNSLSSIREFSKSIIEDFDHLDALINNAGVMLCPFYTTEDGFEIQMGTNHLGHFALTGLLMPLLQKTANSRIVATSSIAHNTGKIDFDDINWQKRKYSSSQAYGDSKLANLYFAYELAEKCAGADSPKITAAHPGWTKTDLQRHSGMFRFLNPIFSQSVEMGVLPTLRAAFDEKAKQGDYFGPKGLYELRGYPVRVRSNKRSRDKKAAKRLWAVSEEMTGIKY